MARKGGDLLQQGIKLFDKPTLYTAMQLQNTPYMHFFWNDLHFEHECGLLTELV